MVTKEQIEIGAMELYAFMPMWCAGKPILWDDVNEHVKNGRRHMAQVVLEAVLR